MSPVEERRTIKRREDDALPVQCQSAITDGVAQGVADGVVSGFKALVQDDKFCAEFWKSGFTELSKHTQSGASEWIGRRVWTWVTTALLIACLGWLVRSGALK